MPGRNLQSKTLLSRWSQHKLRAASRKTDRNESQKRLHLKTQSGTENATEEGSAASKIADTGAKCTGAEKTDETDKHAANRAIAEAVDLDRITKETDFSVFLKKGVPDELKRRGLRVLWRSNLLLANLDGLNDYDEDFARSDIIMQVFRSAWQVGQGYSGVSPALHPGAGLNVADISEPCEFTNDIHRTSGPQIPEQSAIEAKNEQGAMSPPAFADQHTQQGGYAEHMQQQETQQVSGANLNDTHSDIPASAVQAYEQEYHGEMPVVHQSLRQRLGLAEAK